MGVDRQHEDLGKTRVYQWDGLQESSLFLQSIELQAMMVPWGPNCFKFLTLCRYNNIGTPQSFIDCCVWCSR